MLGGVIGLMITAGLAFLIEYMDNTLRTPEDIEHILNLPVIGYIAEMHPAKNSEEYLYVARQPRSPVSEAFRSLRVNLEYAGVDKPLETILITSPGPSEGKTTIAANLAAIIAQGGKTSLLLDADMRRPRIHKLLGASNRVGLSNLFREQLDIKKVLINWNGTKGMSVITSGSIPPNPTELLGSDRMDTLLSQSKKSANVIIIDSPPTLVTDAQVLASKVDGILIVVQPGHTHADSALAAIEQFERAGGRILGVVFNRIPRSRSYYYGGYRYYSPYYSAGGSYHYLSEDVETKPKGKKQQKNRRSTFVASGKKDGKRTKQKASLKNK